MNKIKFWGYAYLLAALLVTSGVPLAYKFASGMDVLSLMFLVSATGTTVSVSLLIARGKTTRLKQNIRKKSYVISVVSFGVLAYALVSSIMAYATHYVSADLVAVVFRTWPIILILLSPAMLRERIDWKEPLSAIVGFSGLLFVLLDGGNVGFPAAYWPYVAILLLAALFDAMAGALSKRFNYDLSSSIFMYNLVAFAIFSIAIVVQGGLHLVNLSLSDIAAILFLGVVQNVVLTFLFVGSLRRVKTHKASNAYLLSPFVTMVLGAIILSEQVQLYYLPVVATVILGMALQQSLLKPTRLYQRQTRAGLIPCHDVTSAFIGTPNLILSELLDDDGKALAICSPENSYDELGKLGFNSFGERGAIAFVKGKSYSLRLEISEIGLVKEMVGFEKGVVIIGIGREEIVENSLTDLYHRLRNIDHSSSVVNKRAS